jgi:N-acetylglucosaminyl-diphospho-decaprenol L-rhamnosyltransferase
MNEATTQPCDLLVVIVNYRTAALTCNCLRSLAPEVAANPGTRAVVVDNDSGDAQALAAAIRDNHWHWASLIVAERNGGFAYGNNQGIRPALQAPAPPRYFWLLNSDTEVRPGVLGALVDFMDSHPQVGIAGSGIENPDGSDWPIAFRFHSPWSQFENGIRFAPITRLLSRYVVARTMENRPAPVDWVSGASMFIRREVFQTAGLMDEGYFLYFEEVDFCLRARRAGWECWYVPAGRIMHICGQSTGVSVATGKRRMPSYWFQSRHRYFVKNHGLWRARLADLAFGTGFALWRLRRALLRRPDPDPPFMLRDFWRTSILFKSARRVHRELGPFAEQGAATPLARSPTATAGPAVDAPASSHPPLPAPGRA